MYQNKNTRYFKARTSTLENMKKHTRNTMDKKRLRVALKVLERVKKKFPDTKKFVADLIDEECQKEKISADEVIFFTSLEAKS